jgi:hypothetical protein
MAKTQQERVDDDNVVIQQLIVSVADSNLQVLDDSTVQALVHIAGYLARTALNRHKCCSCQKLLVDGKTQLEAGKKVYLDADTMLDTDDQALSDSVIVSEFSSDEILASRGFTERLNRGKLLVPSEFACKLTKNICNMYQSIVKNRDNRLTLFGCNNPRAVFSKVVVSLSDTEYSGVTCSENKHSFINRLLAEMAGSLSNCFTSNYAKEKNSEIHQEKKRKLIDGNVADRSSGRDKISKLSGQKKN